MAKRRFGVSLPEELASELDRLAEDTGMERSRIVEEAVRSYIKDARGGEGLLVLIVVCGSPPGSVIEEVGGVISHQHVHADDSECIDIIVTKASNTGLIRGLIEHGCRVKPVRPP